jgi:pyruvate dehydrogenase E1 component alpha subunit
LHWATLEANYRTTSGLPGWEIIVKPPKELAISLYRGMVEIREFELKAREIFRSGRMPGFIHIYVGEEAGLSSEDNGCAILRSPSAAKPVWALARHSPAAIPA